MSYAPMSLYSLRGERKYLTSNERQRFMTVAAAMPEAERLFCLTLVWTGCRISEALALTGNRVSLDEQMIAIVSLKKRGKMHVRQVPVPAEFANELSRFGVRADGHLWPWGRTKAWQLVKSLMNDAGIHGQHAMPRALRHTFGVHAIQSGIPVNLVQRWLGHSQVSTTAIYLDVVGEEERELAGRMWDFYKES